MTQNTLAQLVSDIQHFNLLLDSLLSKVDGGESSVDDELLQDVITTTHSRNNSVKDLLALTSNDKAYTEQENIQRRTVLEAVAEQDKQLIELLSREKTEVQKQLLKFRQNTASINLYNTNKAK